MRYALLALTLLWTTSHAAKTKIPRAESCLYSLMDSLTGAPLHVDPVLGARLYQPVPGVFIFLFDSYLAMGRTFVRFQEHYESPRFRGRTFSMPEFVRWYRDQRGGRFSYFTDWGGFNFPSTNLAPFLAGDFDPLLPRERRLLDLLEPYRDSGFYVVGIARDRADEYGEEEMLIIARHEVAHALYFLDPEYRRSVDELVAQYDTRRVRRILRSLGYADEVMDDEVHAYLLNDEDIIAQQGMSVGRYRLLTRRLNTRFEEAFRRRKAMGSLLENPDSLR